LQAYNVRAIQTNVRLLLDLAARLKQCDLTAAECRPHKPSARGWNLDLPLPVPGQRCCQLLTGITAVGEARPVVGPRPRS
jgi:hypothetical protein